MSQPLICCRDDETESLADHDVDLSSALGEMYVCEDLSGDAEDFNGQDLSGYSRDISYTQEPVVELAGPVLAITGELSPQLHQDSPKYVMLTCNLHGNVLYMCWLTLARIECGRKSLCQLTRKETHGKFHVIESQDERSCTAFFTNASFHCYLLFVNVLLLMLILPWLSCRLCSEVSQSQC